MKMNLRNRILLLLIVGCTPSILFGSIDITIKAEEATISDSYTIENSENASNGTFVKLKNNPSVEGTITYTIEGIPANGSYKMEVFHFNGGINQSVDISINGGLASTKTLHKSNWAYQDKARSTLLNLDLVAGTNTITLKAMHATILIDKITVTDNFNVYYVATNGDDSNAGTYWKPWKTLAKASGGF